MRVVTTIDVFNEAGGPIWHASKAIQVLTTADLQEYALRGITEVRRLTAESLAEVEKQAQQDAREAPAFQERMEREGPRG